jgi:shikimate kinase
MGSGKSTIGPILANTIGYDFVDLDRMIENRNGQSINEIFRTHGEEHFRRLERALIEELSSGSHLVISLGGGTLVDPSTFTRITSTGIVVYLKATQDQLFKRLHHKTDRPVLFGVTGERLEEEELRARIQQLYERREPVYSKADIIVPTDGIKVGATVDLIVRKLSPYLE